MNYLDAMQLLSDIGFGAMVLTGDKIILNINEAGDRLLHGDGALSGTMLREDAWTLCSQTLPHYTNLAFGEYLTRCKAPSVTDLPFGSDFIVFRDASIDACHDMLVSTLNQMPTSVVICDADCRMYYVNDADVNMESMTNSDISGDSIYTVYDMLDGSELVLPQVIKTKKPILNHRQIYATRPGRKVDAVANAFPLVQNGQILGAVNLLQDWTHIDKLQKQVLDLQQKLVDISSNSKSRHDNPLPAKYSFDDIIHASPDITDIIEHCKKIAQSDSPVMIYGETGTGKELFAQGIHNASQRSKAPFLAINCAAIPENLLESILFGTEKGAYTGAEKRAGLFEQAENGTLLLDEINSMNINLQAKLLRVLQEHTLRRVGGVNEIPVNVRIITNINVLPNQAVMENKLRQDLYFRLGAIVVKIPPLRERKSDLSLLAKHFIMKFNKQAHTTVRDIHPDVLTLFKQYNWPGNVRELQHAIEYAMNVLPNDHNMITREYLPDSIIAKAAQPNSVRDGEDDSAAQVSTPGSSLSISRVPQTYQKICSALIQANGNLTHAAQLLGISRQNLQYHIKKKKIDITTLVAASKNEIYSE